MVVLWDATHTKAKLVSDQSRWESLYLFFNTQTKPLVNHSFSGRWDKSLGEKERHKTGPDLAGLWLVALNPRCAYVISSICHTSHASVRRYVDTHHTLQLPTLCTKQTFSGCCNLPAGTSTFSHSVHKRLC